MALVYVESSAGSTAVWTAPANATVSGIHVSAVAGAAGATTVMVKVVVLGATLRGGAVQTGAGVVSSTGASFYFPTGLTLAAGATITCSLVNQADTAIGSAITTVAVDYK